jgi:hypothetical protein
MLVVLEGQIHARGELSGENVVLSFGAGAVTGVLPFSRMKQVSLTGRATVASRLSTLSHVSISGADPEDAGVGEAPRCRNVRPHS